MSIPDVSVEATHRSKRPVRGRSPEAMTALAGRIRALQQSEPVVVGDERTSALAELALLQLELERLTLSVPRHDTDLSRTLASTFTLAEQVDQIARLWPSDAAANLAAASAHRTRPIDPDRKAA